MSDAGRPREHTGVRHESEDDIGTSGRKWCGLVGVFAFTAALAGCEPGQRVFIDAIQFNHDSSAATRDALNVRQDFSRTVEVPEWRLGESSAVSSPAAYGIEELGSNTPSIKVRVQALVVGEDGTATPIEDGDVELRASGGGVLGAVDPVTVHVAGGRSSPEYIEVPLAHATIGDGGVRGVLRDDIEWQWSWRLAGEGDSAWRTMGPTRHRIYAVLRAPREPWKQSPYPDTQNPWTRALDFACGIETGLGEGTAEEDVSWAVAQLLNPDSSLQPAARVEYDTDMTAPHYTSSAGFNLTGILDRIEGREGAGQLVNCDDCAAMMTTFGNLLGADLWEGRIVTNLVNPVMPIGHGRWWMPFTGFVEASGTVAPQTLDYHAVAWQGDVTTTARVYDLCYFLNYREESPEHPHPTERIFGTAYGTPFSAPGVLDYRERLANPSQLTSTLPNVPTKRRRNVY